MRGYITNNITKRKQFNEHEWTNQRRKINLTMFNIKNLSNEMVVQEELIV